MSLSRILNILHVSRGHELFINATTVTMGK